MEILITDQYITCLFYQECQLSTKGSHKKIQIENMCSVTEKKSGNQEKNLQRKELWEAYRDRCRITRQNHNTDRESMPLKKMWYSGGNNISSQLKIDRFCAGSVRVITLPMNTFFLEKYGIIFNNLNANMEISLILNPWTYLNT